MLLKEFLDISLLTELMLIWGNGYYKHLAPNGAKAAKLSSRRQLGLTIRSRQVLPQILSGV